MRHMIIARELDVVVCDGFTGNILIDIGRKGMSPNGSRMLNQS